MPATRQSRNMAKARPSRPAIIIFLALGIALLWQQVRVNRLAAESAGLRAQLGRAVPPPAQSSQVANVQPSTDQTSTPEQFRELLRLRGQVGMLRSQLEEAIKANRAEKPPAKTAEPEPSAQPLAKTAESEASAEGKSDLATSDALLKAQEQALHAATQKLADVLAALDIPWDVTTMDAATALDREDLKQYRSYFEAKNELDSVELYTRSEEHT